MRPRPFFSYYGAKWSLAPKYPRPLGSRIIEPFAGSAQYSTLHWRMDVTLVEKNPIVCAVWRWLIAADAQDVLSIPLLDEGQSVDDLNACQEARWLVGFWINKATTHPCKTFSSWAIKYRHGQPGAYWSERTRSAIAKQIHICNHWEIIEGDYTAAPQDPRACYFVDPPYQGRRGDRYKHGSTLLDYDELGSWCRALDAQVIVCEGQEATWLPFKDFGSAPSAQKRHGVKSIEKIWTKGCVTQEDLWHD